MLLSCLIRICFDFISSSIADYFWVDFPLWVEENSGLFSKLTKGEGGKKSRKRTEISVPTISMNLSNKIKTDSEYVPRLKGESNKTAAWLGKIQNQIIFLI